MLEGGEKGGQLSLQRAYLSRRVANLLRGGVFLSGPIFLMNTSAISDGVVYISLVNQRRTEWRVCYSSRGVVVQEKREKKWGVYLGIKIETEYPGRKLAGGSPELAALFKV